MNKKNYKKQYAKKASAGEGGEMLKQREQKQAGLNCRVVKKSCGANFIRTVLLDVKKAASIITKRIDDLSATAADAA